MLINHVLLCWFGTQIQKLQQVDLYDEHARIRRRVLNDRLLLAERSFLQAEGLKGRGWFKHLVSNASSKLKKTLLSLCTVFLRWKFRSTLFPSCTHLRRTTKASYHSSLGSPTPSLGQATWVPKNGRRQFDMKCGKSPVQFKGRRGFLEVNSVGKTNSQILLPWWLHEVCL